MIPIFWHYIQRCRSTARAFRERGCVVTKPIVVRSHRKGVTIKLTGSMARFSGNYPWRLVPFGVALLRVLRDCEPPEYFERLVELLGIMGVTGDELERVLGVDSKNVEDLFRSLPLVLERCPTTQVAEHVHYVMGMNGRELGRYVRRSIPL